MDISENDLPTTPGEALAQAMAARAWPQVVDIIETSWRRLTFTSIFELGRALIQLPPDEMQGHTTVLALRHIVPFPPADPATLPAPPLRSAEQARAAGASDQARAAIDTTLALGLAYQWKNRYRESAAYFSEAVEITRAAQHAGADGIGDLIAAVFNLAGQINLTLGELDQAIAHLLEAYEFAPQSERASMAYDVTGRLALIYAVQGDVRAAGEWLVRQENAPSQPGDIAKLVDSAGLIAHVLIAIDALDPDAASTALDRLLPGPFTDPVWPFELHARTLFTLGWGDRLGLLDRLHQARTAHPSMPEARRNGAIAAPLLAAAEANLLMSLGRGNQAWAILNYGTEQHPLLDVARARLALLTEDAELAAEIVARAIPGAAASIALDLTLIRAVARIRLGRPDEAIADLREVIARTDVDRRYAFTGVPRADLTELVERAGAKSELDLERLPDVYPARLALVVLTAQEQLVVDGLAQDKSMADLAAELHLTESTVTTHRRHLYSKLDAHTREQALAAAAEFGLLNWPE